METNNTRRLGGPRRAPLAEGLADLSPDQQRCALRLIMWRVGRGLSATEAADLHGVVITTYSAWERGSIPDRGRIETMEASGLSHVFDVWALGPADDDPTLEEAQAALDAWRGHDA